MESLGMHAMPTTAPASVKATVGAMERLLDHFQHLTFVRLRPSCIQNGTYRCNRATFFANDFANVLLRHPEFDDNRVFSLNTSHMHFFWFLHNGPGNLLNQFLHGRPLSTDSTIGLLAQPPRDAADGGILPLLQMARLSQHQGAHGMRVAPQRH